MAAGQSEEHNGITGQVVLTIILGAYASLLLMRFSFGRQSDQQRLGLHEKIIILFIIDFMCLFINF